MTRYSVHRYPEPRLVFEGIEAGTPEEAAAKVRDRDTTAADDIDDCDGETFAALVDVVGDKGYEQTGFVAFEPERLRKAAPDLLATLSAAYGRSPHVTGSRPAWKPRWSRAADRSRSMSDCGARMRAISWSCSGESPPKVLVRTMYVWYGDYITTKEGMAVHTGNEPRSERIDIRTTPTVKRLLQQAAAASRKHVSEFLLEQGRAAAAGTLADRRLFLLEDTRWRAFLEALERPAGNRPALNRLLTEPGLLD